MADNPENMSIVNWFKKSLCIPTRSFRIANNPTSPPYSNARVKLMSYEQYQEPPPESFELVSSSKSTEKETQTDPIEKNQPDTPKFFVQRAKEILASRISSQSSPNNEIFNRFDDRYKSEIIRGSFSTPKKVLLANSVPITNPETPNSFSSIDEQDYIKGIQSNKDFYFDDDFSCPELPINLKLISKCDDELDELNISAFNGIESFFEKSLFDHHDASERTENDTLIEKEEKVKTSDSMGTFKDYLHIVQEDLV